MARRALATLIGIGGLLSLGLSSSAHAVGRDGEGRIQVGGGLLWVYPNNSFVQDARAGGYDLDHPYALGPHLLATFGYWFEEQFEISIEGGYDHNGYSVPGMPSLTLDSESLMASLRWVFLPGYDFWPYLGGSFGYCFNNVNSPFQAPWNSWTATGYGEAVMVGSGWDLNDHLGVSLELRYTFNLLVSPFNSPLNAGGFSLLAGIYLRVPRSVDSLSSPSGM